MACLRSFVCLDTAQECYPAQLHSRTTRLLQIEGPMQVARRSDVDMNGHINNVTYIAWALETVPRDVYYNYELQQVVSPVVQTCGVCLICTCSTWIQCSNIMSS